MNRIDWIKAKASLLSLDDDLKNAENTGFIPVFILAKALLIIFPVLLALVEEKIQER